MFQKIKDLWTNSAVFRYAAILFLGVVIGAVFYPSKRIEEKVKQEYQLKVDREVVKREQVEKEMNEKINSFTHENFQQKEEYNRQVATMKQEIRDLRSKKREVFYKIVKPDGTVEERREFESEDSETSNVVAQAQEQFNSKIAQMRETLTVEFKQKEEKIKSDFDIKEKEYKEQITKLEQSKVVEINQKNFGIELGVINDRSYYLHATGTIWGPLFLGVHGSSAGKLGTGLGIRF